MSTPTLKAQALAVRRMAVNHRGHVDNLRNLVGLNRRPLSELQAAEAWLPDLDAAAATLGALAEKEDA